jgi:hypothetical protein
VEVAAVREVGPSALRHPWKVFCVDLEAPVLAVVLANALVAAVACVRCSAWAAAVCVIGVVELRAHGLRAGVVGRVTSSIGVGLST